MAALPIDCDAALDGLLSVLTLPDRDAYAHAYRVAALSASVGCALQLGEDDMAALERAALLHDVGKLAMPEALLRKPAPLTIEEQDLIRQHPQIAADLIAGVPYLASAAELVRDAHERIDGLGYPNGTHAADVALGARIISVADAFDAMTRPRVFRDAITPARGAARARTLRRHAVRRHGRGDVQARRANLVRGLRPRTPHASRAARARSLRQRSSRASVARDRSLARSLAPV